MIGNPTDMYGGSVISCSTKERAECILDNVSPGNVVSLEVSGDRQQLHSTSDLALRGDKLDIARAVLIALDVDPATAHPFVLHARTNIPMHAGLAGSTAILASITGAVLSHLGLRLNQYEIAELVRKIEYDVMRTVCGFQDHYMAVFGGLNYMDFRGKFSSAVAGPQSPFATIEPLQHLTDIPPLVLAHTGVQRHSGTVHSSIRDRWLRGDADVVEAYERIAVLARAGKKALLACDWDAFAALMNENHILQRDLGGSSESNERLITAALDSGAVGAKLAGAGGGGTIIALSEDPQRLVAGLLAAGADAILYPMPSPGLTIEIPV